MEVLVGGVWLGAAIGGWVAAGRGEGRVVWWGWGGGCWAEGRGMCGGCEGRVAVGTGHGVVVFGVKFHRTCITGNAESSISGEV